MSRALAVAFAVSLAIVIAVVVLLAGRGGSKGELGGQGRSLAALRQTADAICRAERQEALRRADQEGLTGLDPLTALTRSDDLARVAGDLADLAAADNRKLAQLGAPAVLGDYLAARSAALLTLRQAIDVLEARRFDQAGALVTDLEDAAAKVQSRAAAAGLSDCAREFTPLVPAGA